MDPEDERRARLNPLVNQQVGRQGRPQQAEQRQAQNNRNVAGARPRQGPAVNRRPGVQDRLRLNNLNPDLLGQERLNVINNRQGPIRPLPRNPNRPMGVQQGAQPRVNMGDQGPRNIGFRAHNNVRPNYADNLRREGEENRHGNGDGHTNQDDRRPNQNRNDRPMGFRALQEISQSESKDIILKIRERNTSFMKLLESTIDKGDLYVLIMQVLSTACQSSFGQKKQDLLLDVCNSKFISNLRNYLMDLPYTESKAKNLLYWNDQKAFWKTFITFCDSIVNISPNIALQKCRSLIEGTSKCCLEELQQRHGFVLEEENTAKLIELRERLNLHEKKEKEETRQKVASGSTDELEPPDDFRQLSIVPSRDDLLDQRPFVRPNVVAGSYRDTNHYLDVQFRLLREDCFGPLREGIIQLIENPARKKYDNIRVYPNVKFLEPYISKNKIGEIIQLDEKSMRRMKRINWAHSKRFIFGSLILLTKDNCKSFLTATILDRDLKLLSRGMLPISIVNKSFSENLYGDDAPYTMIESEVYFEPYFHVLKALQDPEFPQHLAMEKYIVKVDPAENPPSYLNPETQYKIKTTSDTERLHKSIISLRFKVLDESTWPSKERLGLNETQYEAYKLALTHEFAVIQGPPGTGKTFLGTKVAETLLKNLASTSPPMLIICYTNHALDQFLEHILNVTSSVVRIGGQSRNEKMEKLNLTTLRKATLTNNSTRRMFQQERDNLKFTICKLQNAQKRLDHLSNGVVSFEGLSAYIDEVRTLGEYYSTHRGDVRMDPLQHWLFENMEYIDIETVLAEELDGQRNLTDQIKPDNTRNETDDNQDRTGLILDEFEDDNLEEEYFVNINDEQPIKMSFSVINAEKELKRLIGILMQSDYSQNQVDLVNAIVKLKSQIKLFNEMAANRGRNNRCRIHNRMNAGNVAMVDRWTLYFRWANAVHIRVKNRMIPLQEAYDAANMAYEETRMMLDLQLLEHTKVIGMTTSGAARLRKLLLALEPSIVIVEEAAEVLEQHIVTSLTKNCKHLVLIGDHQQLRPSSAHMKLARHYNIEVSLFERMITNGIHSRRLGVQHRMRPEIAALISPHIYPELKNHPSVEQFSNVRGMTSNLFFFSHNYKEEVVEDSASKSNQMEADMTLKLANYLMQQGYEPEDVTVLAAYSGQMFYMRKQRDNYPRLSKVKITVVDNYQGEESKIILLSLVRNNDENKIGFLGTENRICVALSRAREGFYIFGNMDILKRNSPLWEKIFTTLDESGSVGSSILLRCETHPEHITTISSPSDFDKVPEGGCLLKCPRNLACNHPCPLICHGYDRGHNYITCYRPCERVLCELEHVCPLKCSMKCEECNVLVEKKLPCGHNKDVPCHKKPSDPEVLCYTPVTVTLPSCEHEAKKLCYLDIDKVKCSVPCVYRVAKCGHECRRKCHVNDDPDHEQYKCMKPCANAKKGCTADLIGDRGDHQCSKMCHEDCDECTIKVTKKRKDCKHSSSVQCNEDVNETPCRKNCARSLPCGHHCKKKCNEPCGDCMQKVTKTIPDCNHKVAIFCKDEPTRDHCKRDCQRKLDCGHDCTQKCNQPCDIKKCTKIVDREFDSPCGHKVKLPCNLYQEMIRGEWGAEELLKHCSEPCGQWLACEHPCRGTCGSCHQGRIHVPCKEACDKPLFCGHSCNEPCNKVCPPCNSRCEIKCAHSQCKKFCGAPCQSCKEKCKRNCRHLGACKNRCGEKCSRPPCDEACDRTLRCGHPCRGLCGEPCPNICQVCQPDTFPVDFLGDPFEDDVKFIQLQDCRHQLAVEDMDTLMMGDQSSVEIRACPLCRKPILNTCRYKDIINNMLQTQINPIKQKIIYGKDNSMKERKQLLISKIGQFEENNAIILEENEFINKALIKLEQTVAAEQKMYLVKTDMLLQYLEILDMIVDYYRQYQNARLSALKTELNGLIKLMCTALMTNVHKVSQQLQIDIKNELKRMNSIVQFATILSHSTYAASKTMPEIKKATETATQIVLSPYAFDQDASLSALKNLETKVKVSGIVTKEERDLIVKAIGSKSGSWYKCPNGHFYCISNCGGAMETSKCPDCGATIGGRNHALVQGNDHAGEIDGSTRAAWPTNDDMRNYQF